MFTFVSLSLLFGHHYDISNSELETETERQTYGEMEKREAPNTKQTPDKKRADFAVSKIVDTFLSWAKPNIFLFKDCLYYKAPLAALNLCFQFLPTEKPATYFERGEGENGGGWRCLQRSVRCSNAPK